MKKIKIDSGTHKKTTSKHHVAMVLACRVVFIKSCYICRLDLSCGTRLYAAAFLLCGVSFPNVITVAPHVVVVFRTDVDICIIRISYRSLFSITATVCGIVDTAYCLHEAFAHKFGYLNFGTYIS